MKKTLQVINMIAFLVTIFVNYWSNTGNMNNTTIGDVSGNLNSLFTPAGYAFAIWGLIYLLLLGFAIYQARSLFVKVRDDHFVLKTGWWFVISCLANSAWVFAWIYEFTGLSILFMLLLLVSLLQIVLKNSMELWDAPVTVIAFLWWPFVIYSGWITVASVANISAYLVKIQWNGFGLSEVTWTLIMIGVATSINLLVTWKRNMREFALVGAWALIAIGIANLETHPLVSNTAYVCAAILVASSLAHGVKNFSTNPMIKLLQFYKK